MFTGLVETTGKVSTMEPIESGARMVLEIPFSSELSPGDSVAVNGCCLTVSELTQGGASFDLLAQTLQVTSLGTLRPGIAVNLERALLAGSRIGGHFMTGHIDTVSEIIAIEPVGEDHRLDIVLPRKMAHLLIPKGSIAVDGISLTAAEVNDARITFTCWITPHTHATTNLSESTKGDQVNLEFDLLAKHLARLKSYSEKL